MFGKKKDKRSLVEKKVDALTSYLGLVFVAKGNGNSHSDHYIHYNEDLADEEFDTWDTPITTMKKLVRKFKDLDIELSKPKK